MCLLVVVTHTQQLSLTAWTLLHGLQTHFCYCAGRISALEVFFFSVLDILRGNEKNAV